MALCKLTCFYFAFILVEKPTADWEQTKPRFFVKATRSVAFTKDQVVGLFGICCKLGLNFD